MTGWFPPSLPSLIGLLEEVEDGVVILRHMFKLSLGGEDDEHEEVREQERPEDREIEGSTKRAE